MLGLIMLTVLASGCQADSSTTMRALGSWTATVAMLGQAWADGATPRAYTTRALERAKRQLATHERALRKAPPRVRVAATPITERVGASTRKLAAVVAADDRAAARALVETLAVDAWRLRQLAHGEVGPS